MSENSIAFMVVTLFVVVNAEFQLVILHDNDVHAHLQQMNKYAIRCKPTDAQAGKCFGGVARTAHMVTKIRGEESNVLFLNAGDWFQGTIWYAILKWKIVAKFMKLLKYDCMSLGNHEFDDGIDGLTNFLDAVTPSFPVLASNIDDSKVPAIQNKYNKSVVLEVGEHRTAVGIIGYVTPSTKWISTPGDDLEFVDEIPQINKEAVRMKNNGIKFIVALGHSGFFKDKEIAQKVPDVDIVVGGHTNTFLYTGRPPSIEVPEEEYPFVVTQASGKKVPVVQDYAYGKYLGYIKLIFSDDGNLQSWSGNPILLDNSVPQDKTIMQELEHYAKDIAESGRQQIGVTKVFLDGDRGNCVRRECNFGDFLTDAMVHEYVKNAGLGEWTAAAIAIQNSGGIRSSVNVGDDGGVITREDVLTFWPFQNTIDLVTLKGVHVREMLEFSVRSLDPEGVKLSGGFLQVSGIRVKYDLTRPSFDRILEVLVRCKRCPIPIFEPLQDDQNYTIAMPNFLANGGDKYNVIKNNRLEHNEGTLDQVVIENYIKMTSPITQGVEGRIIFVITTPTTCTSCSASVTGNTCMLVLLSFLKLVPLFICNK